MPVIIRIWLGHSSYAGVWENIVLAPFAPAWGHDAGKIEYARLQAAYIA
jgi:hypothetical protein